MKTLVKNNISLYVFSDESEIVLSEDKISVGNPIEFFISDCNSSNSKLYSIDFIPNDWIGGKYLLIDSEWTINPDYVDISVLELENGIKNS